MGPRRASDNHWDQGAVLIELAQEGELRERGASETPGEGRRTQSQPLWCRGRRG